MGRLGRASFRRDVLALRLAPSVLLHCLQIIILPIVCLIASDALAQVTEAELRDALLEKIPVTAEMDVNQDGVVDVADLIRLTEEPVMVQFTQAAATLVERATTCSIPVVLSAPFSGTLAYTAVGSATAGHDYETLPGSIVVEGTAAVIPITIIKDYLYEEQETVQITLEPGTGYEVGSPSTFVLTLQDIEAAFEASTVVVSEGSGIVDLRVRFNYPCTGRLAYSMVGTASAALDYEQWVGGGSLRNVTETVISLPLVDDLERENTEYLTVDLRFNELASESDIDYDLGVPSRVNVLIQDNDTVWVGTMITDDSQETFQMEVLTDGQTTLATILSVTDPLAETGFLSAGTIPGGTWTATAAQWNATGLYLDFGPIPLGRIQLLGNVDLQRRLSFRVLANEEFHSIRTNSLIGEFTSTIEPAAPGRDHLRRTETGPVIFIRGISNLPFPEHEVLDP